MRASAKAEQLGVPTVAIVATAFRKTAELVARGLGMSDLKIAHYPGAPMTDSPETARMKARENLLPEIIAGLTGAAERSEAQGEKEPEQRDIVYRGTLDEVNEHFHEKLWTDGMAIIPPSISRVARFLRFTDRAPGEVLGVCPPENREATIWSVATNGVMAGCKPEYMPVLVAIVECILDPEFQLNYAGSTPGWEPLIVLNGPIVTQLDFNSGAGVMRVGRRANTSIGRFLKLFMRNLAGCRITPGDADKGSIGQSFNVVLAECEDECTALGWSTFALDRGFQAGQNVVTVQSEAYISPPTYSVGDKAMDHMRIIHEVIGQNTIAYWSCMGLACGKWHPLLVMGPGIARAFANDGWSKDGIRGYLYENVKLSAEKIETYARHVGLSDFSLKGHVAKGLLPPEYAESDDPNRLVRCNLKAEWIGIVVAGDPGRNQSKCYVTNHYHGAPVSRQVQISQYFSKSLGMV